MEEQRLSAAESPSRNPALPSESAAARDGAADAAPAEESSPKAAAAQEAVPGEPEPSVDLAGPLAPAEARAETPTGEGSEAVPAEGENDPAPAKPKTSKGATLYRALRSRRPLKGIVEKVIKGGYEVRLGRTRGFCPHSQFDLMRVEDPEQQVGKTLTFRITQVRRGGDDVVVSRRAVLEDERKDEAMAVRATLIEGSVTQGRVAGLAEFGVFVDLGAGVMGLVHVSELSHSRVVRVQDFVKVGDQVPVKVTKLHESGKKISLSIRQAQKDPWSEVAERIRPGDTVSGCVKRLADFGAFVEVERGVEALAPASEFPPARSGWREGLEIGGEREWIVLSVDAAQRRISLAPRVAGFDSADAPAVEVGAQLRGRVQRVESYGVFVWLAPGRVGLMPNVLSGEPRGAEMVARFPVGDDVEVEVLELGEDGRRIRLAKAGVKPPAERPRREPSARQADASAGRRPPRESRPIAAPSVAPAPSENFGTSLGDKLRAALDRGSDS